ncbi:MAG: hypothetical protein V5A72_00735 [Candidatus Nanohaloarchaea archaeon]
MSVQIPDSDISLRDPGDICILTDVVNYLEENYTEQLEQGPIYLTGSAVNTEDNRAEPNDYDILVQRWENECTEYDSVEEHDDRIVASMMRDLSDDAALGQYNETNPIKRTRDLLNASENVRPHEIGVTSSGERSWRIDKGLKTESNYKVEINDVNFDILFTPASPNEESIQLTPSYR